jgi:two-component system cell cycle sensor histidine kinase/response regulator CckA
MSILIVDDEAAARKLLNDVLTAAGFRVRAADCGELALASIAVTQPELVLVDICMPEMDGFEVCRRLRQREDCRDVPVIFLSADGDLPDRLEAFRLGAVDFISKPFHRDELLARVRNHLELARLRHRLEESVAERTAQLRESKELFRTMAEAAPVMIWTSGPDMSCTYCNRNWLEFTGRTLEEERGSGWADGIHPEDRERCTQILSEARGGIRPFEMEYRLRRADGEYRWLLDRGVPRISPAGAFSGYIGSCLDITDLKLTHERILASQKLESLGVMAAGVAHDFGNLLSAILCSADLALSEIPADSVVRTDIERISEVATRGSEIVRTLMMAAGAGQAAADFTRLDLASEVDKILRLLTRSISKRAVVYNAIPKDLPPIFGNASQIHQVVLNLLTNASDALGNGQGSITVSAGQTRREDAAGRISLGLPEGDYVRLKVSDTGCGMSSATRARIFDPFFSTKSIGRGLGLAAVHGIVRAHGGAISVDSAPGAGTTFEVWFPCAASAGLKVRHA